MNNESILLFFFIVLIGNYILDLVVNILNLTYQKKSLPERLKGVYTADNFIRAIEYFKTNTKFEIFTTTIGMLSTMSMIYWKGFAYINTICLEMSNSLMIQSLLFFGILFFVADILSIPFTIYKTFVIEEKFGFNKMTIGLFFMDKIKGILLTFVFGGLILYLLLALIQLLGQEFWIWFWLALSCIIILVNSLYTTLLLPLFNKLTPLADGDLKKAIEMYAQKINFPLQNIFVMDGSKRSSKSNAFFSGFGKRKKIVLYDTLIKNHSTEELVAIIAHEAGHYKKNHITQSIIFSIGLTGLTLFLLSLFIFNDQLSLAFGSDKQYIHLNIIGFYICKFIIQKK